MNWENRKSLCQEFARILGGQGSLDENGVCLVEKFRTVRFKILGRRTRSPLVTPQFFTFEDVDSRGRALNLGETVLLQEEVNPLLTELEKEILRLLPFIIIGYLKSLEHNVYAL